MTQPVEWCTVKCKKRFVKLYGILHYVAPISSPLQISDERYIYPHKHLSFFSVMEKHSGGTNKISLALTELGTKKETEPVF
jgi:hypothetical protein